MAPGVVDRGRVAAGGRAAGDATGGIVVGGRALAVGDGVTGGAGRVVVEGSLRLRGGLRQQQRDQQNADDGHGCGTPNGSKAYGASIVINPWFRSQRRSA